MRKLTFCISILILLSSGLQAQEETKSPEQLASFQIRELREGVLLLRLPTKQNSIDALIKTGRTEQAEQIKSKNRVKNLELIQAIQKNFTFCPVYYFNSYDSEHILNGNIDSVQFLNDELVYDPSIKVGNTNYYTAEITLVSQDTSNKSRSQTNTEERDRDNKNEAKFYGGANLRFEALIIKDDRFKQLRRPFPYYSRTLNSFFIRKSLDEVIKVMDQKLWKFHGK